MHYWKKHNDYKNGETLFDLVEESKISEYEKKSKKYKNPVVSAIINNHLIRDIKRQTIDFKNIIEEK